MGISLAGVFKMEGMSNEGGTHVRDHLISLPARVLCTVIRLLPHVLPIRSGVLQFPGDKGFSLPRDRESDTRIRVQSIPQNVGD